MSLLSFSVVGVCTYSGVYLMLAEFNLGRTKFMQQYEIIMNFNFYNLLGDFLTQCFASIRMVGWLILFMQHQGINNE